MNSFMGLFHCFQYFCFHASSQIWWCGWLMRPKMFVYMIAQTLRTFKFTIPLLGHSPVSALLSLLFFLCTSHDGLWLLVSSKAVKKEEKLVIYISHFHSRNVNKSINQTIWIIVRQKSEFFGYSITCSFFESKNRKGRPIKLDSN